MQETGRHAVGWKLKCLSVWWWSVWIWCVCVCARGELGDGSSGRRHVVSKLNVWMFRCLNSECFNLMCVWDGSSGIICLHVHMFERLKINCLNLMMKCLNWEMGAGGEDMWSGSWNVWMFRCLSVWRWSVWIWCVCEMGDGRGEDMWSGSWREQFYTITQSSPGNSMRSISIQTHTSINQNAKFTNAQQHRS